MSHRAKEFPGKKWAAVMLSLLFLATTIAPKFSLAENLKTIVDSSGREVQFAKPFSRIISLYSAHTENICSLDAADLLVGIGTGDDYPETVLHKPMFSYREDPEKFIGARPDLVLVRPMIERSYPEFINKLRQVGITVVSLQPNSNDDIFSYWQTLGILTGREQQAEQMKAVFSARLADVRKRVQQIPLENRPRVYFEAIHSKMKTFAPDSIAAYVLEQAGGVNLAADAEQVRETNIAAYGKERLLSRGADIDIYLAQQGRMNPVEVETISGEPGFQAIKAVREGKILLVAEPLVSRPTLRIIDGIEHLHTAFFPETTEGSEKRENP